MSAFYSDPDQIADAIIGRVGRNIVLALPLGLGKAVHIANALVSRALKDQSLDLRIFTALTLEIPQAGNELEQRFLAPAAKRLFGNYPELSYATLLRAGELPANIRVSEFFFLVGQWLNVAPAQQNYIPANYTHALSYILERGVNVVAQLVARRDNAYSLSCNPDILPDLLKARQDGRADFIFAVQLHDELPFMAGAAQVSEREVDFVLAGLETDFELYAAPKRPVSLADQAIGLHAARLLRDGGTLQIGIGSIGDAVAQGLILRHKDNRTFRQLVGCLALSSAPPSLCHDEPFAEGLYAVSEMFVDAFLHLAENGILKREVDGAVLHGAFFVDTREFYRKLRDMSEQERGRFQMMPVGFTNELFGDEQSKRKARVKACFINNAMMATLRGAVISDGLDNGAVVSGVGGQYNFVAQAFALEDARSVIALNTTRQSKGKTVSNIVWSYGHTTIPWHLRDLIVTEYGVADLRGKTEAEAIAAMLSVSDSRFQEALLAQAKSAGKIDQSWRIPEAGRHNTPERIENTLKPARQDGILSAFPFGTDFTETEQRLLPALKILKEQSYSTKHLTGLLLKGLLAGKPASCHAACLERMNLGSAGTFKDFLYQKLLQAALLRTDT